MSKWRNCYKTELARVVRRLLAVGEYFNYKSHETGETG